MTRPTEQSKGLTGVLLNNPATRRLADQVQDLAKAGGSRLAGSIGERLSSGTDKLNDLGDSGGQTSSLIDGARRLAEGQSPLRAAAGSVMSNVKDKVKGALGAAKGGAGGKGGPPKATNIEESVDIGVPVSVAFDQWTQYAEFAKFMKGVEAVEAKSETEQNWRVKVFKSRRSWQAKVTEQVPDRRIVWTSEGAKGSVKGAVTFHPLADDLTRVLLAMEYYPSGFMEKTGNIWRAGGRRARLDLKHFRRFITLRGEATGSWRGEIRDGEVVRSPDDESDESGENTRDLEDAQATHDENDQVPATSRGQGGSPESSDQNSEPDERADAEEDERAGAEEPVRA
ncbi:Polyketide cyclase / dehydrase and lipid transport [Parafrankia irregularis]|uniref:Polyketide cyclase / dehydrase and lipid transport n=1 Tax=Parafrankia irregularis TaxID=795642 RepID=A0A0S4QX73_9ACTN|nr:MULTISPECIES: SRPBCC family protein [Parafrankia]MBE3202560.1 SRPBCC family protein [Parafrankia sp. CH37]CUU59817.1 Polyketide cyclase / dehydrase and lipid transport [Parafrankia irregularis]